MKADQTKSNLPKPSVTDSRVLTYLNLNQNKDLYVNTLEENELVYHWNAKYVIAKAEYEASRVNSDKVKKYRDIWLGEFNKLEDNGDESSEKLKAIRKIVFELIEDKVNARIPDPKMTPRYYSDLGPVQATEALIKQEMDKMLSEEVHDESERSTLIDSTTWLKVSWDPFDNTHERSGMPIVENCPIDTVFPQPGVSNYKKLEYIFEKKTITLAQALDLYNRNIISMNNNDLVNVIECYYLNEDRHVGRFVYVEDTLIVLANDLEWGMRRRRECTECGAIVTIDSKCPVCGSKSIKYVGVKEQILDEDLTFITNPYRTGSSPDPEDDDTEIEDNNTIPSGTKIPFYLVRQLPFVPKRNIKVPKEIYGVSEVQLHLESQDMINKLLNKVEKKSDASKAVVTKLKDTRIDSEDKELLYVEVESAQEAAAIQVKQVMADISQEMAMVQYLYDGAKSTAGVTDTDQGKNDPSARSGKAKQLQMAASQSRQAAPQKQRSIAYAGVYELIFKYLLAFSDEERSFVNTLPDGSSREEVWSKYMFLDIDKDGNYYYRDDFAWSVDPATEITQDRASMWQLIDNDFLNGVMGSDIDPVRALRMYWHMKKQYNYPTAKFALAFLDESIKHLPTQVETALVNNPQAVELALNFIADMQSGQGLGGNSQHGGARDGAGRANNGQSQTQQVSRTNNETRAAKGQQTNTQATSTGGAQGGTSDTNK